MIYVIRHAESRPVPGVQPSRHPLTERGERSALALVGVLQALGVERIYSSPYRRAIATVEPYAERFGVEVHSDWALRERDLAAAPMASPEAHVEAVRRCWADFEFRFDGGESNRVCQARAVTAVRRVVGLHPHERLAIASHGQWTSLLLNALDPAFGVEEWLAIPNPAVYEVDVEAGKWRAVTLPIDA